MVAEQLQQQRPGREPPPGLLGRAGLDQAAQPPLQAFQVGRLVPDPVDDLHDRAPPNGRRPVPA
jgi:hypothetical protein